MMTNTNPPSPETRDLVYLAGLLHDIGKFFQRADPHGASTSTFLQDYQGLQKAFCPKDRNGFYTHKHVLWTAQFFETFRDLFADALTPAELTNLKRLASAHHHPNTSQPLEIIIQLADHFSSGIDRTSNDGLKDEFEESEKANKINWDDFKKVRMVSVFETVYNEKTVRYRLPVTEVKLNRSYFPQVSEMDFDLAAPIQYQSLWKSFQNELATISQVQNRPRTKVSVADTLLHLLEKYAVTVPSSTQHLPDVSLYDHLKSTAAMSLCLYDYLSEKNELDKLLLEADEAPLLLIGGDLSGIQAFIYDIIGRSAAKNLKGRSFYLQLMVDSIVQHLLDGLNLYSANIVYSSGGGFYILAPNTNFIHETLPILQQEIASKLRNEQGVRLFLAIDSHPVTQSQIYGKVSENTIGDVWAKLSIKLSEQKKRRFANTLPTSDFVYFFMPGEVGGESRENRDAITSEEFLTSEKKYPLGPADDEEEAAQRVRKPTFEQIRLGRTLRETVRYVVKSRQEVPYWEPDEPTFGISTNRYFNPLGLQQHYYFIGEKQLAKFRNLAKGSIDNVLVQSVNTAETSGFQIAGNNQTYGFTFYGGNTIPRTDDNNPKYFDQLTGPDRAFL